MTEDKPRKPEIGWDGAQMTMYNPVHPEPTPGWDGAALPRAVADPHPWPQLVFRHDIEAAAVEADNVYAWNIWAFGSEAEFERFKAKVDRAEARTQREAEERAQLKKDLEEFFSTN